MLKTTEASAMRRRAINPWTWQDAFGYVQANEISGAQRVLICSGQLATEGSAPSGPRWAPSTKGAGSLGLRRPAADSHRRQRLTRSASHVREGQRPGYAFVQDLISASLPLRGPQSQRFVQVCEC
jgi:hypothetical protein